MSQFSTSRGRIPDIPRAGSDQSLAVFGPPAPGNGGTPGQARTFQYLAALGDSVLDQIRNQQRRDEQAAKEHQILLEGQTKIEVDKSWPEFVDRIETGDIVPESSPEGNAQRAEELAAEWASRFDTQVERDEARKRLVAPLTVALETQRKKVAEREKQQLIGEARASIQGVTDPKRFASAFDYMTSTLRMTKAEAYEQFVQALKVNAADGDEAAVRAISEFLPDVYKLDKIEAASTIKRITVEKDKERLKHLADETATDLGALRNGFATIESVRKRAIERYADDPSLQQAVLEDIEDQWQEWQNERRVEADRESREAVNGAINEIYRFLNDRKPEQAIALINRYRESGLIEETDAATPLNVAENMIESHEREALKREVEAQASLIEDEYLNLVGHMIDRGLAPNVEDLSVTLNNGTIDGKTLSITRDKAIESVIEERMAQIDEEFKNDPDGALARQTLLLTRNGVTYRPWEDTLKAGATAAMYDLVGNEKLSDEELKIPTNAERGFDLYLRIKEVAQNPAILYKHMDQSARQFYELAESAMKYGPARGDRNRALAAAARALTDPEMMESRRRMVDEKAIKDAVEKMDFSNWIGIGDIRNRGELQALITEHARTLAALGASPDQAQSQAIENLKNDYIVLNHWVIPVNQTSLPREHIKQAGEMAIAEYVRRTPESTLAANGVSIEDLTLKPLDENTWVVVNANNGLPVSNWSEAGFVTNREMVEMANKAAEAERKFAASEAVSIRERRLENEAVMDKLKSRRTGVPTDKLVESVTSLYQFFADDRAARQRRRAHLAATEPLQRIPPMPGTPSQFEENEE